MPNRRAMLALGGCVAALGLLPGAARSTSWPARPVRVVLGYTPGGAADVTAREVGTVLGQLLGQPLVVDYKAGASGTIAAAEVARATPDGYTLGLLDNAPLTIVPAMRNAGYDPLGGFTHLGMVSQMPQVLVASPSAGVDSVQGLVETMRRRPGSLNFGSGGPGSVGHLTGELFLQRTGSTAVHVPFRGGAPVVTALLAGDVQYAFLTATATAPMIASGKLKALGVSSLSRLDSLPQVPAIADTVPQFEVLGWFALAGPPGLPDAVVQPLRQALAELLATPAFGTRLQALGQTPAPVRGDLQAVLSHELATWKKLFAERKIVLDV